MEVLQSFSERLKELMAERGVNAPALARELGLERSTVNGLARGAFYPSTKTFLLLLDYFNCSSEFLLGRSDFSKDVKRYPPPPFGERFRAILQEFGVSQYELEKNLRLSGSVVYRWLNNLSVPSVDSLIRLSDYLHCTVDYLIGREQ